MRFSEKVCLVTGGGSGIGQAAAERFALEGGQVVVVDINPDHGNATVQGITKAGGQAIFAQANVGDSADVQAAVNATVATWGMINVVVNDAAMMTFTPIVEQTSTADTVHMLALRNDRSANVCTSSFRSK